MWEYLFYDKYASINEHKFDNEHTKNVTIEDLNDGSYKLLSGKKALNFYNKKFEKNFEIPEFANNLYKLEIYTKRIKGIEKIFTVVGINSNLLENFVKDNKPIPNIDFIENLCRFHMHYTDFSRLEASTYFDNKKIEKIDGNIKFITDKSMNSVDYVFDIGIENQKHINENLYKYQKCSINWMVEKENSIKTIKYNINDEVIIGNVYYDIYNHKFDLLENRKQLAFYGGGLIDEVGLGKTVQMITLAINNQPDSINYYDDKYENMISSRATLILCPNQLCGQWIREVDKMVSKDYGTNVIPFMTKRHFDKYTYQDLLDADFVLVSFTFLDNKAFTLPWTSKISKLKNFNKQTWSKTDFEEVKKVFNELGKDFKKDPFKIYEKCPMFPLIHWNRIIVDEFHEIHKDNTSRSKYSYIKNLLPFLKSDYRWVVTATPFINKNSLYNIIDYLTEYKNKDGMNILSNDKFVDYLSTDCFRRNTKNSVKEEHTLPPIKDKVVWLKFSATERMMYNAYLANPNNDKFSVYLRQLCCHPQLADETKHALLNCKSLKDIETIMLSHYKKEVEECQDIVDKIKGKIKKVNKNIKKMKKNQKKRKLKKLKKLNKKIKYESDSDEDSNSDSDDDSNSDSDNLDDDIATLMMDMAGIDLGDIDEDKPLITLDNLYESLDKLNQRLYQAENELEGKTTTFNFFNNVINRLRKTASKETDMKKKAEFELDLNGDKSVMDLLNEMDDSDSDSENEDICGICYDEIPENDVGVTKCGHIFCYECLKIAISQYHKCPMCQKKLKDTEVWMLSYEKKKKTDEPISPEDKQKDELIDEIGTKLANLIFYLRETDEHVIIFSQWDDLLRKVGKILKDNKIKNVFCKGNCYQRDKAIREFNSDDKIKVIMLSSDSSASGTNLTKASQVIMLDPIYGNYKYRKDQEKQAVGRAHRLGQTKNIQVLRFIVKDSVEEEIYWMNINEDKKHTENITIQKSDNVEESE